MGDENTVLNWKLASAASPRRTLSRARCGGLCSVELLLCAGADFVELRMQPSDFGIQFDETQAGGRNQLVRPDTPVILTGGCFQAYTSGGLLRRWIPLQV